MIFNHQFRHHMHDRRLHPQHPACHRYRYQLRHRCRFSIVLKSTMLKDFFHFVCITSKPIPLSNLKRIKKAFEM